MQRSLSKCDLDYDYYPELVDSHNGASSNIGGDDDDDVIDEPPPSARLRNPRKSIRGESFNPEQFIQQMKQAEKIIHAKTDQQRKRLSEAVKLIFLFRSLDQEQVHEVLDAMFERTVKADENVIRQGDPGDYFYVIDRGSFKVYFEREDGSKQQISEYHGSGSFGELALMYSMPRAATVQASTEGSLWVLDRSTFQRIVVGSAYQKRKTYEEFLQTVPILRALTAYERMNLADALVGRSFDDGSCIIRQGDAADGMYFVESGLLSIKITGKNHEELEVSQVRTGGYFGELALVTQRPRAASVYCKGPVRLAFLDAQAFERLLGPCMDILKRNMADYENQLSRIFGTI